MRPTFIPTGSGTGNVRFTFNGETYDAQTRIHPDVYGGNDNYVTIFKGFEVVARYVENMNTKAIVRMFCDSL